MYYDYTLTLLSLRMKTKPLTEVAVTNRKYNISLSSTLLDDLYLFNAKFTIREGR